MNKKPSFSELFFSKTKDFLDTFLLRQEQRSKDTVKAYRISLTEFYRYVTGQKHVKVMNFRFSECTYELMLDYSQYLQEVKKLANSTVNQRLAAIKSYLKYVSDGDIELMQVYLSVQKVPLLRIPKLQKPVMEKDELEAFLAEPEDTRFGRRDRVILILLFDSAIRVSELTAIILGDVAVDVKEPSIMIHGKGRKTRTVILNDKCARHLRNYIHHFHDRNASPDTPLFYTVIHGKKNHMSQRNVERIVKKYGDLTRTKYPNIPETIYPHLLRRTRATGLYRNGVPIEMISAILGHEKTETTKIYASPSVEQLREAIAKGQPEEEYLEKLWEGNEEEILRTFGLM